VHAGPDGETLVIGYLLYGDGRGGGAADRVLTELPQECGDEIAVPGVDLAAALPRDLTTFRYTGSLTTSRSPSRCPGTCWPGAAGWPRPRWTGSARCSRRRRRDTQPLNGRTVALRPQRPGGHH
jgi:carbonic anhydrase